MDTLVSASRDEPVKSAAGLAVGAIIERWALLHPDDSIGVMAMEAEKLDGERELESFCPPGDATVLARVRLEVLQVEPRVTPMVDVMDLLRRVRSVPRLPTHLRAELDAVLSGGVQ